MVTVMMRISQQKVASYLPDNFSLNNTKLKTMISWSFFIFDTMIKPTENPKLPFKIKYSFNPLVKELQSSDYNLGEFRHFISVIKEQIPAFITGVDTIEEFAEIANKVEPLIEKIIPRPLMKNNLKAINYPLSDKFLYPTDSLKAIMEDENSIVKSKFMSADWDDVYKICCCLILNRYYGLNIEFNHTNLLEVDNDKGYISYLSVSYDFEYFNIYPTDQKYELTEDQIEELLNNYDNTRLWYDYFPIESWIGEGFTVASFFDNTTFIALSKLKTNLLSYSENQEQMNEDSISALKSIFRLKNLSIGFSSYDSNKEKIEDFPYRIPLESLVLDQHKSLAINQIFCTNLIEQMNQSDYYVISNVSKFHEKFPNDKLVQTLKKKGIESFVIYPLKRGNECLGVLELGSSEAGAFNRINAYQLKEMLPLIEESIYRYTQDLEHQINSFIQTEYTSLHPSVEWKFVNRAKENLLNPTSQTKRTQIKFKDVYPFYGEVDVRNSSSIRNRCLKLDYQNQIKYLIRICKELYSRSSDQKFMEYIEQLNQFHERIDLVDKIYFEQEIFDFITFQVHPQIPKYVKENEDSIISEYLNLLDNQTGLYYIERRKFDESIALLNKLLATRLDVFQNDAQSIIPHYYERFKTDGIDYNLYVGRSINPKKAFDYHLVKSLRFWQLQAMIALEQNYKEIYKEMPIPLEVASMILTTNIALDITFKLDEKRFDVDGYNNAKYEIIKKRINKAYVKDSIERINVPGKLCIIYYEDVLREEYIGYLDRLIAKGYLTNDLEFLEVEELQGLSGLFAIRVGINYANKLTHYEPYITS